MKRVSLTCIALIVLSCVGFSQFKLEIEIIDIKNNNGKIMLQVFDELENILIQEMDIIKNRKCSFSIKSLKKGKYAIRYYHDENLNGLMDTNLLEKPTEGYGFSNNVTGKFGPPPFEKWLFEIKKDSKLRLIPTY